ncbi:MAG: alpha-L-rhamnosidase C-terminal domain-containing protein [Bacillota bacterium]
MRTIITERPFVVPNERNVYNMRGAWPCKWIGPKEAGQSVGVMAYRRRFALEAEATIRVHVSADERYELFVDGQRVGRGPERGDPNHWFFETYDLKLKAGQHVIVARVWSLGKLAPAAQMTVYPGFILAAEEPFTKLLGTGVAEWEVKKLSGYDFVHRGFAGFTGARVAIDGKAYDWGFEQGQGEGWQAVAVLDPGVHATLPNEHPPMHLMLPATLPAMLQEERKVGTVRFVAAVSGDPEKIRIKQEENLAEEQRQWNTLLEGRESVTVPANAKRRVLIDLKNYYCAYPTLVVSGGSGATVRVGWAESLFHNQQQEGWHSDPQKGNRDEIEGKLFMGNYDLFKPEGGNARKYETLWWCAGRYVEVFVETVAQAMTIERLSFTETRYPLEMEGTFAANDTRLSKVIGPALRGLQMCSHETYMDCPYYEQLEYVGDTRMECLVTYCLTQDDRLPRKAIAMFDASVDQRQLTQSRFPSRMTQYIPPFSLYWVAMLHDYALWRDVEYVRRFLPSARTVVDTFLRFRNKEGLVAAPDGWNFVDWVPGWDAGCAPSAEHGVSAIINWQLVGVLSAMAELENQFGEVELAARDMRLARELAARCKQAFWDESRGLFADDLERKRFSEHAQCMAILSGRLDRETMRRMESGLLNAPDLARTTIYYTHYLFETYRALGAADAMFKRMDLWMALEKSGLMTTPEQPEPTRSDCHGWGSHVLYHYYATILGLRPGAFGFKSVRVTPMFGPLTHVSATLPHPKGQIGAELTRDGKRLTGQITLPEGVTGEIVFGGKSQRLASGKQDIRL